MGWGGDKQMTFPQYVAVQLWSVFPLFMQTIPRWLGQNSKQGKLARQLSEVQIHMRLKVSGDKTEIRQSYLPALFPYIVKPLAEYGSVCSVRLIS